MTRDEHESRLRAMTEDHQQTWDLSPNDVAAIKWALYELKFTKARLSAARESLQGISYTIETNNEQNGFWGVASAHGTIRAKCIAGLEASKELTITVASPSPAT